MNKSGVHDPLKFIKETMLQIAEIQEGFVLPEYKDDFFNDIPDNIKKMGISSREIYDVINDFDMSPVNLSKTQKELRKKYLQFLLNILSNDQIKSLITQKMSTSPDDIASMPNPFASTPTPLTSSTPNPPTTPSMQNEMMKNYDATLNTIKRIINLLIMEIDMGINCGTCNKTPYILGIIALVILLVIMIIVSIICFSRSMS